MFILVLRQDIMQKENLNPPETFDELLTLAKQLNGLHGTEMGFAIGWYVFPKKTNILGTPVLIQGNSRTPGLL